MPDPRQDDPDSDSGQRLLVMRRQVVTLTIAALAAIAYSVWRAGWRSVFPHGWWR